MRSRAMTLAHACTWLERATGKRPSIYTLRRWVSRGLTCRGQCHRLPARRLGRLIYTTTAALRRFVAALKQPLDRPAPVVLTPRQAERMTRRQARVVAELSQELGA